MKMDLPTNAKRVFKGVIFDVYQWEQKLYDGSSKTFEMLKRVNTVEVIATVGSHIVMAEQEQPTKPLCYSLLGGRQEGNEEPIETAKRELLEESGLVTDDWELLQSYQPHHKIDWNVYVFAARDCRFERKANLDAGERIKLKEVSFDEFIDIIVTKEFWGEYLALDTCRMKISGTLEEFRRKLFKIS